MDYVEMIYREEAKRAHEFNTNQEIVEEDKIEQKPETEEKEKEEEK